MVLSGSLIMPCAVLAMCACRWGHDVLLILTEFPLDHPRSNPTTLRIAYLRVVWSIHLWLMNRVGGDKQVRSVSDSTDVEARAVLTMCACRWSHDVLPILTEHTRNNPTTLRMAYLKVVWGIHLWVIHEILYHSA